METQILIEQQLIELKNDQSFLGRRLIYTVQNLAAGASDSVVFRVENPRIARVDSLGVVWPEGAGTTYVVATLWNGKATAKCKVAVTDANEYKFRLILKDKGVSDYPIGQPLKFLSAKAIERRRKQNIAIDATDLPISSAYLRAIEAVGGKIVAKSKWLNTVSVHCEDQFLIDQYKALPFVKDVVKVWQGKKSAVTAAKYVDAPQTATNHTVQTTFDYGSATDNISINNGQVLHQQGFKGAGIDIAVIDEGFIGLKNNSTFKNINIKGAKSFVFENDDPYSIGSHGVEVTSCMAINLPGKYVGTAPEANYWLFRTEDGSSEFPVEEDYWVAAAEYADSVGVDVINSSLYYATSYGLDYGRYKFEDMDGKTAMSSRGANMAASKGILILNCAGNDRSWVGAPADAPGVLAVGSVSYKKELSYFSSWGITVDGRMKPDVMAQGGNSSVIGADGAQKNSSGTSFASPTLCGLVACLWQAFPKLTAAELREVVRQSGDKASKPEVPFGYGISDMQQAMKLSATRTAGR
ncbi:S8 family peptidase [Pedobacter psychrodurus]|uniref:S8 family peptidase n=1 Tax=Pedobacter psychrodurus TaxID=2530456 RepID=UPI00292E81DA|nr:S8 family serine peptidase [Pedobacter psychrodurus]